MFGGVVVINVENVVDLQWFPSNFHIHPHQSAFLTLWKPYVIVSLVEMSFVVPPTSPPSVVFPVEVSSMVLL